MNIRGIKLRANLSGVAFILSLTVLFLQQFYAFFAVSIVIHAVDTIILLLIIAETFLPMRQEKYFQQYFQKHAMLCFSTLLFCAFFIFFKLKIGLISTSSELILIFALIKNIFLFAKIIKNTADSAGGTERVMLNPAGTLLISFFMVIITGTFLLMLPAATPGTNSHLDFLTALFTATSAVCVTGLSVVDISTELTTVGQVILILLIQIGGLGIMVFSFFGMLAFRRKLSIAEKLTVSYMVSEDDMSGLFKALRIIVFSTFLVEALSAGFLFLGFSRTMGISTETLGFAAFHAVSAFCNAGFALFSNNLESFTGDPIISLTISFTIILGGIGFAVMYDTVRKIKTEAKNVFRKKKTPFFLPLNTQIVLAMTAGALFISFAAFYLLEHTHAMKDFSLHEQYLGAFFQAVTLRTAGFSTISFASLTNATLLMMIFVMFVGGASGSTAGGIKLNTVAVVFAFFRSFLKNDRTVIIKKMSIPDEQVKKAFLILGFGLTIVSAAIFVLTVTESLPFLPMAFETVSAFATVGLSTGITSQFSVAGKLILIFLMFIGRVGPLPILTAAGKKGHSDTVEYPCGAISIG